MSVALVSACYGGYDMVSNLPLRHGFDDAVLVSDRPVVARGWRVVVEPHPGAHPRLAAKRAKAQPWRYTDCASSVWMDASMTLRLPLGQHAKELLAGSPLVLVKHPARSDVYPEAVHSQSMLKYAGQPVVEQVAFYRGKGLPDPSGLWALGVMLRRHDDDNRLLGEMWLAEMRQWSLQDQLSLPWLVWRLGLRPATWDIDILRNEYWFYREHRSHL